MMMWNTPKSDEFYAVEEKDEKLAKLNHLRERLMARRSEKLQRNIQVKLAFTMRDTE